MTQAEKAVLFNNLHVPGNPLVLYNIWDAGSAKAVVDAGASAVATGSWSVAGAQGYADGQAIPLDLLLQVASRIAATVECPVTIDFEGAYAETPEGVATNIARLIGTGAIGINFEDQIVGGPGLFSPSDQSARISAARRSAQAAGVPMFINARTDLFLKERDRSKHADLVAEAKDRAAAYAESGASGYFVPGLVDPDLIGTICSATRLPVNVMMMKDVPPKKTLASLGIARISYGPRPYVAAMANLAETYRQISDGA